MKASQLAVALCVLGAMVPAAMAGVNAPMFAEWFHAQKAGPSIRARAMGGHQEGHMKQFCLQELQQYNCRTIGCANVKYTNATNGCGADTDGELKCGDCKQGEVFQSDLTCCGERDSYSSGYGGDEESGGFGSAVASPTLKIGTCDWDINLYQDRVLLAETSTSAHKIGSAWATCYLSAAAEYCGTDVLCDKMVLTFKGGVYEALVKSTLAEDLQAANPDLSCLADDAFIPLPDDTFIPDGARRSARGNVSHTFDGVAEMISGMVTITSLDRRVEYTTGYMDYVARFLSFGGDFTPPAGVTLPLSADKYPTVTPNTYTIRLTSNKAYATS